jgi:hypothetical protein
VISLSKIEGGAASTGGAVKHLMNATITPEQSRLAAYYNRLPEPDKDLVAAAYEIADGVPFSEAMDKLVMSYLNAGHDPDGLFVYEEKVGERLSALADRIIDDREEGHDTLYAPVAVIKPDLHPMVAEALGIQVGDILSYRQVESLLAGRRADNEPIEGKKYAAERERPIDPRTGVVRRSPPTGSIDLTVSPSKSFAVTWAFSNDLEKAKLFNCHLEAAREAVAYIGEGIAVARIGKDGAEGQERGHLAWLEFTHHTSRKVGEVITNEKGEQTVVIDDKVRGDPEPHTHFLIPNAVVCESGRVGSLDTAAIRGLRYEADAYYQARMATKLREAGYDVVLDERTGSARMTAIPQEMCDLFSKRSLTGEKVARQYTASRGEDWDALTLEDQAARIKNATQLPSQKEAGGKDDMADFEGWRRQAIEAGWEPPTSFLGMGPPTPELTPEERQRQAYEIAVERLADKLERKAVLSRHEVRSEAFVGLIHAGNAGGVVDADAVTKLMRDHGIMQRGERTELIWGREEGKRQSWVSTALHERDELEFVRLAKSAAMDRSLVLSPDRIDAAARESGLDFTTKNGKEQLAAIHQLGQAGRFAVTLGAAGSGKSSMLKVLGSAWHEQGRDVWAASLAWRQADDLVKAKIDRNNLKAFSVLLDGIRDGSIKLTSRSVVAVDELALLGTFQGLSLLREREKHGFSIVALGDDRQVTSIQAGQIVDLCRQALSEENIPAILTTQRQQSEREQIAVGLLRENRAAEYLAMKREAGEVDLVAGRAEDVIARTAALYAERLTTTGHAPSISTPTNGEAHAISEAVRVERRKLDLVGPDLHTVKATDGERQYDLKLAKGDHVRLFESTKADVGGKYRKSIGRNGSIMEVLDVGKDGIRLRNADDDRTGFVEWRRLAPKGGRPKLAYGNASTIHTSQGSTANEHILSLPRGSKTIDGGEAYSASTRHRHNSYLITSAMAEYVDVRASRHRNDTSPVTDDDRIANIAHHMISRSSDDDLATKMTQRSTSLGRGTVRGFHAAHQTPAHRQAIGQSPSEAPELHQAQQVAREPSVQQIVREMAQTVQRTVEQTMQLAQEHVRTIRRGRGMSR